jgi:hypothetical protein
MASWKQYGSITKSGVMNRINTESLTVNTLILKEAYPADLQINGSLTVNNMATFDSATVNGNMIIGRAGKSLTVNADVTYYGRVFISGETVYTGNLEANESILADKYVFVGGNIIYFGRGPTYTQTIINNSTGMGINTLSPVAGLHLETTNSTGLKIKSTSSSVKSILLENNQGKAIVASTDPTQSKLTMYTNINTNNIELDIISTENRSLLIDTSYVNILNKMAISLDKTVFNPNHTQTLTVYSMNNTPFYQNIYNDTNNINNIVYQGSNLSLINNINNGLASLYIKSATKGLSVIGGTYSGNISKTMGAIQLNDATPSCIMVSGDSKKKYFSTTGINTYQPDTGNYVLDINGPVIINNNEITYPIGNVLFEICDVCESFMNKGVIVAIGNEWGDVNKTFFKKKYLKSDDYGENWTITDISYTNVSANTIDKITSIHMYDTGNIFITGENNTFVYGNGTAFNTVPGITTLNGGFNHVFVNPFKNSNNSLYGYFCIDSSSSVIMFEKTAGYTEGTMPSNTFSTYQYMYQINSIKAYKDSLYIAGNNYIGEATILKYSLSVENAISNIPVYVLNHTFKTQNFPYTYYDLQLFDNSYAIAVGRGIISSTKDGGINWFDTDYAWDEEIYWNMRDIPYRSSYILDSSNAIAVGNDSYFSRNILITNDCGNTWLKLPDEYTKSSGKNKFLSSTGLNQVIVPDKDNILILNTNQFIGNTTSGSSTIYNIFTPNFRNRYNNYVLDIYGSFSISGDIKINDGDLITTKSTLNIFNGTVKNINLGGDATINIGNIYGNTYIKSNAFLNETTYFTNTEDSTTTTNGALRISGGVGIIGNVNIGGNVNATSYNTTSDYRIKSHIKSLHDISYSVDGLNPVSYFNEKTKNEDMGFVAHEVQHIFPFLVNGQKDGDVLQSLNYYGLIPVLVKELQQLKNENLDIKRRLSIIESHVCDSTFT